MEFTSHWPETLENMLRETFRDAYDRSRSNTIKRDLSQFQSRLL